MELLLTPGNLAHLHLLLNHFPTVGLTVGLGLLLVALLSKSDVLKPTALGVLFAIAVMTLPVFTTGLAAEKTVEKLTRVSVPAIKAHEDAALLAFVVLELTGAVAWFGLWRWRRSCRVPSGITAVIVLLSVVSLGLMTVAASIGGAVNHPEILADPAAAGAGSVFSISTVRVANFVNGRGQQWVWPTLESAHFIGMTIWFGVLLLANLRLMGWFSRISFPALHRLLPWALMGFGVNEVSGMFFYIATPGGYVTNVMFYWKLLFLLLAAADLLYLTVWQGAWAIGPGDAAPPRERALAALALASFVAVMYCGRMLPFLGNAF